MQMGNNKKSESFTISKIWQKILRSNKAIRLQKGFTYIGLSGSLRNALLQYIDGHLRTDVSSLTGERVRTKARIGERSLAVKASNQRNIPKKIGGQGKAKQDDHKRGAFSDLK